MEVLKLEQVTKYFGTNNNIIQAVSCIDMIVEEQEFTSIMGASGSGKTTILNCIATILDVTSGNIFIDGKNITSLKEDELCEFRRMKLGFIFQDFNLLDTLTVGENIALAKTLSNAPVDEIEENVKKISETLGIFDILDKFPYEISGGEKQRTACARAFIHQPTLLLADEPTGALDSKSSRLLLETMKQMNEELKATILMVTHDAFSASYTKRVIFIKDGLIFHELRKGDKSRQDFYHEILDVLTFLGGENSL